MITNHIIGNRPNWPTKMPIVSVKIYSVIQPRRNYLGVRDFSGSTGPQLAQVATAHKIARTVYAMLKRHVQYVELGADRYDEQQHERDIANLLKKATRLGLTLTVSEPVPTPT